jgi:hypothetical protein
MTAEIAIAAARAALGAAPTVNANAQRVERLDHSGKGYYLVIIGDDNAGTGIVATDADTAIVMASARIHTRRHLSVDAARAVQLAQVGEASAVLVWRPCQASLSPLYPFWRVTGPLGTRFVDQQERCWDRLVDARA